MRKPVIAGVIAIGLALAGCGGSKSDDSAPATGAAPDETPENAPGIALTDAVVQLPIIAGRPGVAYFTLSQGSGAPRKIAAVHIDGAGRAEMHESKTVNGVVSMDAVKEVPLEAGKSVAFAPGGYHVMLFDLDASLKAGGTAELTITLDNGDKASTTAKVEAAGGGSGKMDGMDMDHM